MGSQLLVFKASSLMLMIVALQLFTGIFNVILNGSIFSGWKQFLITVTFLLVFFRMRQDLLSKKVLGYTLWGALTLVVSSLIYGIPPMAVFYNIFFYIAWVPFFIWATQGGVEQFQKYDKMIIVFLFVACVGLIIDLKTELFSFLSAPLPDIVTAEFLEQMHSIKRAKFIFTTYNVVMPICGALVVFLLLKKFTVVRMFFCLITMAVVIATTASTNAVLLAGFIVMSIVLSNINVSGKALFLMVLIVLVAFVVNMNSLELIVDAFREQIGRVEDNFNLGSRANMGRFTLWALSLQQIGDFSFLEHLMGRGLGMTYGKFIEEGVVLLSHGESSYLQAYAEGGIIGLSLRLLPFVLLLAVYTRDRRKNMILGYGIGVFIVYATAPLFANILSQVLLGMLVGHLYWMRRQEQIMERIIDPRVQRQAIGRP